MPAHSYPELNLTLCFPIYTVVYCSNQWHWELDDFHESDYDTYTDTNAIIQLISRWARWRLKVRSIWAFALIFNLSWVESSCKNLQTADASMERKCPRVSCHICYCSNDKFGWKQWGKPVKVWNTKVLKLEKSNNVDCVILVLYPAVVAWCAYLSASHSAEGNDRYTVDRIPLWECCIDLSEQKFLCSYSRVVSLTIKHR